MGIPMLVQTLVDLESWQLVATEGSLEPRARIGDARHRIIEYHRLLYAYTQSLESEHEIATDGHTSTTESTDQPLTRPHSESDSLLLVTGVIAKTPNSRHRIRRRRKTRERETQEDGMWINPGGRGRAGYR